ncbi:MAG: ubiquitin-like domain-containing protein, partial [Bifidobacterium mongoliense]|nr:ubiquitin-like domain-containing protein [Bifidobacterium mongoliense]
MARRWTPQRLMILRRIRVTICVVSLVLASAAAFAFTARKTVALTVNGSTRTVSTYAMSVDRLLQQQRVDVKTHDLVTSTSGDALQDHAVVTVRSAYQTTITINGQEVPFWTIATSADQLLGFFKENDQQAAKVTVNIGNVYN